VHWTVLRPWQRVLQNEVVLAAVHACRVDAGNQAHEADLDHKQAATIQWFSDQRDQFQQRLGRISPANATVFRQFVAATTTALPTSEVSHLAPALTAAAAAAVDSGSIKQRPSLAFFNSLAGDAKDLLLQYLLHGMGGGRDDNGRRQQRYLDSSDAFQQALRHVRRIVRHLQSPPKPAKVYDPALLDKLEQYCLYNRENLSFSFMEQKPAIDLPDLAADCKCTKCFNIHSHVIALCELHHVC
jgi:hypothetical protein